MHDPASGEVQASHGSGEAATRTAIGGVSVSRAIGDVPRRDPIEPGTTLAGRYRILGRAGGGMGSIYFAQDLRITRDGQALSVALKAVPDVGEWRDGRLARGETAAAAEYSDLILRFRREALTWVRIGMHPNIVWAMWVIDVGAWPYLVMERVEGGDLRTRLEQDRLGVARAFNFARQFCEGMRYAWRSCGIVHRDIKPANVLLTNDDILKIADFGLSRFDAASDEADAPTRSSSLEPLSLVGAGTPAYMAPEQFRGLNRADTRSDVFSFGVMLYEMLTHRRPFDPGTSIDAVRNGQRHVAAQEIARDVPDALSRVVDRCLELHPDRRFQSFDDLAGALESVSATLPVLIPLGRDQRHDRRAPLHSPSLQLVAESYSLLSLHRYRDAEQAAARGIALDAGDHEHWVNRSKALIELGEIDEALRCCTEATRLKSDDAISWSNLAWARLLSGNARGALQAVETALQHNAALADAWMCRGACESELRNANEAAACPERAVELEPHNWKALSNLAQVQQDLGRHGDALASLTKLVRINPAHAAGWLQLGWVHARQGAWNHAEGALATGLERDPANAAGWALRAWVLWNAGSDRSIARQALLRALELDPDNVQASILQPIILPERS
jgi:serine/threonine protein kinase